MAKKKESAESQLASPLFVVRNKVDGKHHSGPMSKHDAQLAMDRWVKDSQAAGKALELEIFELEIETNQESDESQETQA